MFRPISTRLDRVMAILDARPATAGSKNSNSASVLRADCYGAAYICGVQSVDAVHTWRTATCFGGCFGSNLRSFYLNVSISGKKTSHVNKKTAALRSVAGCYCKVGCSSAEVLTRAMPSTSIWCPCGGRCARVVDLEVTKPHARPPNNRCGPLCICVSSHVHFGETICKV